MLLCCINRARKQSLPTREYYLAGLSLFYKLQPFKVEHTQEFQTVPQMDLLYRTSLKVAFYGATEHQARSIPFQALEYLDLGFSWGFSLLRALGNGPG